MDINIIALLIGTILFVLVALIVQWGMGSLSVPGQVSKIVMLLLGVLYILWLLGQLGLLASLSFHIGGGT